MKAELAPIAMGLIALAAGLTVLRQDREDASARLLAFALLFVALVCVGIGLLAWISLSE